MTTLYHSYSYTPYENAPIEPYNYPEEQVITRELIEDTVAYQTEIRELIRYEETDRFGIAEIYPYGADDQPEYFDRLLTYLIEEKLLSDSSQFLAILEDSYKAGKLSLDQAPAQGYLCLVTDKQAKNGIGYLTTMTQQELEAYLSPYKAEIIKEGIDREVKEHIRS